MAVKRKEASINVVRAAEIRIKNVFRNGLPVFFSFSGGKHKSWSVGEQGFVVSVVKDKVTVQYPPQIGNVTNHFFIYADEVANGDWEIRYSKDMQTIERYPEEGAEDEPDKSDL